MDKTETEFNSRVLKGGQKKDAVKNLRDELSGELKIRGKKVKGGGLEGIISEQEVLGAVTQRNETEKLLNGVYEKGDSILILNGNCRGETVDDYPSGTDMLESWKNNRGHMAAPEARYVKEYCKAKGIEYVYLSVVYKGGFYAANLCLREPNDEDCVKISVEDL